MIWWFPCFRSQPKCCPKQPSILLSRGESFLIREPCHSWCPARVVASAGLRVARRGPERPHAPLHTPHHHMMMMMMMTMVRRPHVSQPPSSVRCVWSRAGESSKCSSTGTGRSPCSQSAAAAGDGILEMIIIMMMMVMSSSVSTVRGMMGWWAGHLHWKRICWMLGAREGPHE